jgi:hypothetical protein
MEINENKRKREEKQKMVKMIKDEDSLFHDEKRYLPVIVPLVALICQYKLKKLVCCDLSPVGYQWVVEVSQEETHKGPATSFCSSEKIK